MKFKCTTNSLLLAAKNGSQFNSFENGNRTTDGNNLCYNFVIKEFYSDCVYIKYTSDKKKFFWVITQTWLLNLFQVADTLKPKHIL